MPPITMAALLIYGLGNVYTEICGVFQIQPNFKLYLINTSFFFKLTKLFFSTVCSCKHRDNWTMKVIKGGIATLS